MNDTNWQNLPNTTTPILAEKLNKLDRVITITENSDLNDFMTDGEYYFPGNQTTTNIPAGVNGWLSVMSGISGSETVIKQIWYRHGTANSNDFETYIRTYTSNTWSDWSKIVTENSGSGPSSSKYIKYSDGTMICSGCIYKKVNMTENYEGAYFIPVRELTFPQAFSALPTLTVTPQCENSLLAVTIARLYKTGFELYVWKSQSKSNVEIYFHYVAIGYWK